jgi:hypothetical protein
MNPAAFRINQPRQPCSLGTFFYDLPGTMPIDAEDELLAATFNRSPTLNVFFQHSQCPTVDWKHPLTMMLELLRYRPGDFYTTFRAKTVALTDCGAAFRAKKLHAHLEVQNSDCRVCEVYVVHADG